MSIRPIDDLDFVPPQSSDDPFNNLNTPNPIASFARDKAAVWESFVTLNDFMKAISYSKTDFRRQLRSDLDESLSAKVAMYRSFAERSQLTLSVYNGILAMRDFEVNIRANQVTQNSVISAYNAQVSALNAARSTLNGAINTYNSIQPATTTSRGNLDTAIANYNNSVSSIVGAYNDAALNFNLSQVSMTDLNLLRATFGIPPLTYGQAPLSAVPHGPALTALGITSATNPPGVPGLGSFPSLTSLTLIPTPLSAAEFIALYFPIAIQQTVETFQITTLFLGDLGRAILEFLASINPRDLTLPDAYIGQHPELLLNTATATSPAAGVSSILVAIGPGSKSLDRIIIKALLQSYYLQANAPPPQTLIDELHIFVADFISQIAVDAASSPVLRAAAESTDQASEEVAALDRANAFAESIRRVLSSDLIEQNINRLLLQNPELASLTLGEKEELTQALSGTLAIGLAQLALSQIALSLGVPGLIGQILGSLPGAPDATTLFSLSDAGKLNAVLQDPFKQLQIKNEVSAFLAEQGIVGKVLDNVFTGSTFSTNVEFIQAVETELIAQGVDPALASAAAQAAGNFVAAEVALPFLDHAFTPRVLEVVLDRILNPPAIPAPPVPVPPADAVADFPAGTVNRLVLDQILREDLSNRAEILDAIRSTLNRRDLITVRDFRDEFIVQLVNNGVALDEATPIADNFSRLFTPTPSENPLIAVPPRVILSPPEIIDELSTYIVDRLTPETGVFQARVEAERSSRLVANLRSDIAEDLRVLREQSQDTVVAHIFDRFPVFSTPSVPSFVLRDNVDRIIAIEVTNYMNPIAQDSLRTQDINKQPINFKRNIDIPM